MILVDTTVWIEHLRAPQATLQRHLGDNTVLAHPWVIGEVALGSLADRGAVIGNMRRLPHAVVASDSEATAMMNHHQLWGRGIEWVDLALIASARLSNATLWALDKRMNLAATAVGVAVM